MTCSSAANDRNKAISYFILMQCLNQIANPRLENKVPKAAIPQLTTSDGNGSSFDCTESLESVH